VAGDPRRRRYHVPERRRTGEGIRCSSDAILHQFGTRDAGTDAVTPRRSCLWPTRRHRTGASVASLTMWAAVHGVAEVLLLGFGFDDATADALVRSTIETVLAGQRALAPDAP